MPLATATAPPIEAHHLLVFLLQVGVLLTLAIALGRLAARFGLPPVVGELTAGILVGPTLFGRVAPDAAHWLFPADPSQAHLLDAVGQVGVLLLVGLTGIEMDLGLVRRRGVTALRISLAGLVIPFVAGVGLGYVLPDLLGGGRAGADTDVFALFLGVAMCVSALPVIAKTLMDMNLLHRNIGQLTLTAGTVDDAFGWVMLSVVSAMAAGSSAGHDAVLAVSRLLLVLVVAVLIGRPLARLVLRTAGDSPERTIAVAAAMILLAGAATQALKLEAVFGAFLCGLLIAGTGRFARTRTASLRTVVLGCLAPIFFATAGLRIDLGALRHPKIALAGVLILVVAIVGKFAGAYLGARLSRLNRWEALALGAGMNARGVIEVIVATVGLRLGVLDSATYTIIVLVAVVTSVMAPPLLRMAMDRVEHTAEEQLRLENRTTEPATE
ncbi:High-affinity Na(+)/H(+) antiporter NhaS3 [Actinomadura rubteroloni]|uniref:High-affinity Na(+)/H(+) antiporter NhaS3 n=1 Tax=Actinomadura rubteroloni TaxID=1926885 RepID=A0A2P4UIS9_9ACTN|nr:cation:proton antiporter [Actinomadura rubteroloni]POM24954.1 High-affinity Na(+)/H(+) antiporter NhaS3 [Actinomadura rubteroloni]